MKKSEDIESVSKRTDNNNDQHKKVNKTNNVNKTLHRTKD